MRRQRWWLPLLALILMTNWKPTLTLPVPDEELDTSTKLLGSSVVTSVSVVTGSSGNEAGSVSSNADRSRVIPSKELPGSPADLLRPDKFQFYTLNKDGDVVTKQMTKQEIQSLIAAGGGHLPMEIYEPQTAGDVPTGGMKVADVVQNVQNVLKGELSKPATVMTSMPTIPGHANTEWSSILPAILGGESESAPVSDPSSATYAEIGDTSVVADTTLIKIPDYTGAETAATKLPAEESSTTADYETKMKPTGMTEMEPHTEKPMIQVPVITVDQKLSPHQDEEDSMPVFQMLNTISADKINASNKTQVNDKPEAIEAQKVELLGQEEIARPEEVTVKPIVQVSAVEESTSVNKEVPEMVEINLNFMKSTEKPDSMELTTGIISKVPQVEPAASVSVISETHSTSMKISGHEEVPLREPSKPVIKPDDLVKLPSKEKEPEVMEKPTINSSTDAKLDLTTVKAEPMTPTEVTVTETMKEPGPIAQGVSFLGNLPQAVNTIVTDFISTNSPTSTPIVEEADAKVPPEALENVNESVGTKDSVTKPQTSETLASHTIFTPIREVTTSKKPDEPSAPIEKAPISIEPIYQMMPQITPNKKIPPQGASPAEASSIEHIIETLNDPTGSISGTVAADHYITQAEPSAEPATVAATQTSTAATPIDVETPTESSSAKPMEPLPTELADSLSSMISQISDAKPSVLPVSQDAGLDTTEKKNVVDMQAEEPGTDETTKISTVEVSKGPEKPENKTELPSQSKTEKPSVLPAKIPEKENLTPATASASELTEKLIETSTTNAPVTMETTNLDVSTTVKSDLPTTHEIIPQVPIKKVDEIESPVGEKLKVSPLPNQENLKPDVDPMVASSDIDTDKVTPVILTEASVAITEATQSAIAEEQPLEKMSTEKPATTIANSAPVTITTVVSKEKETPTDVQANVLPVLETLNSESQQNNTTVKDDVNENNTEMPIVHIDITESKPTDMDNTNKSQVVKNEDNGPESPLVRIQLTDPITLINNMIKTASVNTSPGLLVPLVLPENGSVSPNSIASGLIAGFPSSTTQATFEAKPTSDLPELQPVGNTSVNSATGDLKTSDTQSKNITNIATPKMPEVTTKISPTEKIEILETSTLKEGLTAGPEFTVQTIAPPMEPIAADQPEKEAITQTDVTQQTSTDEPKKEESIDTPNNSTEIEMPSTTMVTKTETSDQNLTKVSDLVTVVLEESTTQSSTVSNGITVAESTTSTQSESGDAVNEASKIVETTVNTSAKNEEITTVEADSAETKLQDSISAVPEKSIEPTNSTMSEVPIVRIDIAPEKVLEDMPPKIQLTDLPIVETTMVPMKPMETENVEIQNSQLPTTTQIPIKVNLNDSLQTTTVSSTENIAIEIEKDKPKLEDTVKETVTTETSAVSDASEKVTVTSMPMLTAHQTEEIRIQVNDTAVLVTKRPVSEISGQTLGEIQKTTMNQSIDETPITPKIDPVTEGSLTTLAESAERLPVPVKISELSSSHNTILTNSLTKTDTVHSSGSDTRIRLGEEQPNKETIVVKVEDPRKPIKKNSDSDSAQSAEERVTAAVPTTKIPPAASDDISAHRDKDSNAQPSIKVELTTSATVDEPSVPSKISGSNKLEDKPMKLSEKKPPVRVTDKPSSKPGKPVHKPTMNIKKDDALSGAADEKWTLIPQQVYPALTKTGGTHTKRPSVTEGPSANVDQAEQKVSSSQRPPVSLDHPQSASGLDSTVKNLETDISYFANLCNELAFTFWTATNKGLSTARSLAVSPFGMTSMLAMVFLGARGPTSDQMNDILKLDDVASFNPHLVFQNVTDAVGLARNQGVANAAFVRELFADRSKVRKLMPFYKEQAQQFYDGVVAEVNFATISDLVRRRTNLMIRKQTGGRIKDFVRTNTVPLRSPLAAMSANVFQTDCNSSAASSEGRDGELYFAVSPAVRQRKLVPVPATVWRAGVLAGYEPSLDATAIALGGIDKLVSTIFVIPGQQGHTAPGDTLDHLEQRFIRGATHDGAWNKLLKVLIPRPGLELQVPKFSHRSVINATAALKRMGLEELFSKHADLKGINGIATDLHLADVLQMNLFSTCGDENILSGRHHVEVYPGSPLRNAREQQEAEEDKDDYLNDLADDEKAFAESTIANESATQRAGRSARQVEGAEKPRLKLDRPFLYFVRHNPTGLILHMGRFNPRLLP